MWKVYLGSIIVGILAGIVAERLGAPPLYLPLVTGAAAALGLVVFGSRLLDEHQR